MIAIYLWIYLVLTALKNKMLLKLHAHSAVLLFNFLPKFKVKLQPWLVWCGCAIDGAHWYIINTLKIYFEIFARPKAFFVSIVLLERLLFRKSFCYRFKQQFFFHFSISIFKSQKFLEITAYPPTIFPLLFWSISICQTWNSVKCEILSWFQVCKCVCVHWGTCLSSWNNVYDVHARVMWKEEIILKVLEAKVCMYISVCVCILRQVTV